MLSTIGQCILLSRCPLPLLQISWCNPSVSKLCVFQLVRKLWCLLGFSFSFADRGVGWMGFFFPLNYPILNEMFCRLKHVDFLHWKIEKSRLPFVLVWTSLVVVHSQRRKLYPFYGSIWYKRIIVLSSLCLIMIIKNFPCFLDSCNSCYSRRWRQGQWRTCLLYFLMFGWTMRRCAALTFGFLNSTSQYIIS